MRESRKYNLACILSSQLIYDFDPAIIENIMFPKYKIEFIRQDVYNKKYIELKINGEEVKVEKVNKEELKN
jgi:hypothetical protein